MAVRMPVTWRASLLIPESRTSRHVIDYHDISRPTTIGFSPCEAYEWVQVGIDTHTVHIHHVQQTARIDQLSLDAMHFLART